MTVVDLNKIGKTTEDRRTAVMWLYNKYGPADHDIWTVQDLSKIVFKEDKHATYFVLSFS